jgi:hypothetical protein
MTFDSYVQSVTQFEIVPKVVDNVLNSNVLALRLLGNSKPWNGEQMKFPIKYQKSTTGGSFSGLDTFSTSKMNTRQLLAFDPRGYYQTIVLPGMEVDVNATPAGVLNLVKVEMESAQQDMIDSVGTLFYTDGTGNSNKDFLGLDAIVDDSTSVTTYGGLSRTTYTVLKATRTASGGTLTIALMGTLYDNCARGSEKPSLIVTTEAVWTIYEALLQPTVAANYEAKGYAQVTRTGIAESRGALQGEIGFDALFYRGVPVVRDEKCTAQTLWMLNEKYLQWYGLKSHKYSPISLTSSNIQGYYEDAPKAHGFSWSGLKEPTNQYAEIGQIILEGNLVSPAPRYMGRLTGITG